MRADYRPTRSGWITSTTAEATAVPSRSTGRSSRRSVAGARDCDVRAGGGDPAERRRGVEHVLDVVDEQQRVGVA
jgi:hypothetical protein